MKRHAHLLKGVCTLASLFLVSLALLSLNGQHRSLMFWSDTRLAFLETRIESVEDEFMRRSPLLQAKYAAFKKCISQDIGQKKKEKPVCDYAPILKERDSVIPKEWPQIFDRLMIEDDWGSAYKSKEAHDGFQDALRKYGKDVLRNQCAPIIGFLYKENPTTGYQQKPVYFYYQLGSTSYRCNPPAPSSS